MPYCRARAYESRTVFLNWDRKIYKYMEFDLPRSRLRAPQLHPTWPARPHSFRGWPQKASGWHQEESSGRPQQEAHGLKQKQQMSQEKQICFFEAGPPGQPNNKLSANLMPRAAKKPYAKLERGAQKCRTVRFGVGELGNAVQSANLAPEDANKSFSDCELSVG